MEFVFSFPLFGYKNIHIHRAVGAVPTDHLDLSNPLAHGKQHLFTKTKCGGFKVLDANSNLSCRDEKHGDTISLVVPSNPTKMYNIIDAPN